MRPMRAQPCAHLPTCQAKWSLWGAPCSRLTESAQSTHAAVTPWTKAGCPLPSTGISLLQTVSTGASELQLQAACLCYTSFDRLFDRSLDRLCGAVQACRGTAAKLAEACAHAAQPPPDRLPIPQLCRLRVVPEPVDATFFNPEVAIATRLPIGRRVFGQSRAAAQQRQHAGKGTSVLAPTAAAKPFVFLSVGICWHHGPLLPSRCCLLLPRAYNGARHAHLQVGRKERP